MCDWVQYALLMSINIITIQSECNEPIRFYDNKLCEERPCGDPRNDCPERFDCAGINPDEQERCFYAGRYYTAQEHVDYLQAPSCETIRCRCKQNTLDFTCGRAECDDPPLPDYNDCYYTYNLKESCATGYNCKSNSSNTFRCNVEGTYYSEGQIFEPPNKKLCKQCVCNRHFRGVYDETVCESKHCPTELWYSSKVMNFCAPVYLDREDCCPLDFYCPTPSDERSKQMFKPKPGQPFCRWGRNLQLKIGTRMSTSSTVNGAKTSTQCECVIAPYLTCYRTFG